MWMGDHLYKLQVYASVTDFDQCYFCRHWQKPVIEFPPPLHTGRRLVPKRNPARRISVSKILNSPHWRLTVGAHRHSDVERWPPLRCWTVTSTTTFVCNCDRNWLKSSCRPWQKPFFEWSPTHAAFRENINTTLGPVYRLSISYKFVSPLDFSNYNIRISTAPIDREAVLYYLCFSNTQCSTQYFSTDFRTTADAHRNCLVFTVWFC